ncbi:unnamed protein product [Didymodactylos carnosus]|uniref:Uncharacterized protein n=1 Tax=Didymodactylos carnosus TaxID=1234261 RepID=A0A813PDZ0_9BILA|nr:unnamed protein product [Didymodactylos carnosus]CAF0749069.1 unnamed protein product [Didymodactylos carnosus]CAF3502642.1 unnamed protein product [Didymodactylos carnosus]CAF3528313.1 unnamed protein product [Didymodactylos carnosus]
MYTKASSHRCRSTAGASFVDGKLRCKCGMADDFDYQGQNLPKQFVSGDGYFQQTSPPPPPQPHHSYRHNIPPNPMQIAEKLQLVHLSGATSYPPAPQQFQTPMPHGSTHNYYPYYQPEAPITQTSQYNGMNYNSGDRPGNNVSRSNVILPTPQVNDAAPSTTIKATSTATTTVVETTESTPVTDDPSTEHTQSTKFVYNLKNYRYDYFLSDLYCDFDPVFGKFGGPTGICALPDDRLLVANFDRDSVMLIDITGVVHEIYKDLPTPKAVVHFPSSPQAVVATRKEVVLLDLIENKVITRSKMKGFYPWNLQYLPEQNVFVACDPSGERLVFLDTNLVEIDQWSLTDPDQEQVRQQQPQLYQKTYPYAAYFLPDSSFVLTHRQDKCRISEYDSVGLIKSTYDIPQSLQSFSLFVDTERKCLLTDKLNHRLVSIDENKQIEEYKCKSVVEPHSLTFLSNGTMCITDWTKSHRTSGGISIISAEDLQNYEA